MSYTVQREPDDLRCEDILALAADHPFLRVEEDLLVLRYTNEWEDEEEIELGKLRGVISAEYPDDITIGVLCEIAYVTGSRVVSEDGEVELAANLPRVIVEPCEPLAFDAWRAYVASQRDLEHAEHGDSVILKREVLGDWEEIVLEYRSGRVFATYPDPGTLIRLARMARSLEARLVHEQRGPLELEVLIGAAGAPGRTYSPKETYAAGEEISHPRFGSGVVLRARARQLDVEFAGEVRKLAHGL